MLCLPCQTYAVRRSAFTTTTTTIITLTSSSTKKERELSSFFSTVSLFHLYLLNQISNRMFSTLPTCKTSFAFLSFTLENPRDGGVRNPVLGLDRSTSSSRHRSLRPRRPLFPFPSLPRDFIAFRQIFVLERLISLFLYLSTILFLDFIHSAISFTRIYFLRISSRFVQPSVKRSRSKRSRTKSVLGSNYLYRTVNCILLNEKLGPLNLDNISRAG